MGISPTSPRDGDAGSQPPHTTTQPAGATLGLRDRRSDVEVMARNSVVNMLGSAVNGAFGFLLVVVVTRGLGAAGAGAFFEGLAIITIASNVLELGADAGLMRMIPHYRTVGRTKDLRRMMIVAVGPLMPIGALAGILIYAFAPQLSRVFTSGGNSDVLVPYIHVFALFIPLSALSTTLLASTRGFGTFLPGVVVDNFVKPGIRPLLVGVVIAAGLGSTAVAVAWAAPIALGLIVAALWAWRLVRVAERRDAYVPRPRAERHGVAGEFWRFSVPRGLASVFDVAVLWLDTLLLGALASTAKAGIYTASTRFVAIGASFSLAIGVVLAPQISALLTAGEGHRAVALFRTSTKWNVAATWPFYIVAGVFAPMLLRVFGKGIASGAPALSILCLAAALSVGVGPVTPVLLMAGKSSWAAYNSLAGLAVNIGLNLLLIPRMGMSGAALAWLASIVLTNVAALLEIRAALRIHPFGTDLAIVSAAAASIFGVLGLAVRFAVGTTIATFLLFSAISMGLYAAVLWRFRERLDVAAFRAALRSRLGRRVLPAGAQP